VTQRPATDSDLELIYQIYCDCLGAYIVQTWGAWDGTAQRKRFDEVTRAEDHCILVMDGSPIGCVCVKTSETEIRLVRLSILPPFQNHGIGSEILRGILAQADNRKLPVRLRVLRVNPAQRLYERHGFQICEESETHYTMVRALQNPLPNPPPEYRERE